MLTIASLFSGGGGVEVGAINAGIKPIWGIENDASVAACYAANIKHRPIIKSVADVEIRSLNRPDILWASPPCQEFSNARSKKLSPRTDASLGASVIPYLEILTPRVFFLENVEGYRKSLPFHAIVDALHRLGYWTNWEVLNAADFGVPQTRRRLILRAVKGSFVPSLPARSKWRSWYEAIADLIPTLPESQFAPWQLDRMPELSSTSLVEGVHTIRECTVRSSCEPSPCVTAHWMHRPVTIPRAFIVDQQSSTTSSGDSRGLTIRQQHEPVFTITATSDRKPTRAWLEQGRVVVMTARALARFQSFPDSYQLPESRTLACKVLGNAVPPLLAEKLLLSMQQNF